LKRGSEASGKEFKSAQYRTGWRVHPLEEYFKNHVPVKRECAPNKESLETYCTSKHGKRIKKAMHIIYQEYKAPAADKLEKW